MNIIRSFFGCVLLATALAPSTIGRAQNPLFIPPALSGTDFNLTVQEGTKELVPGKQTPTYGVNGDFLAPTLIMQGGDSVSIVVQNQLATSTTMHWHGLHVPAKYDGGPHQTIGAGKSWNPRFRMLNSAGTYWYHPHGEGKTEYQVARGIAGMIIVHDKEEQSLDLPRSYGVDDFPVIIQTKAFDELYQFSIATEMDTLCLVNGTVNPVLKAPAQVIRLRLLNGSSMRSYYLGLSNNKNVHLIATDGGLIRQSLSLKRLRLSPGERAEILIDLQSMQGQQINLRNYGSELTDGIYGAAHVGNGMAVIHDYAANKLNGADYDLLKLDVVAPSANPVTSIAQQLVSYTSLTESQATVHRSIELAPESMSMEKMVMGPFVMNGKHFSMDEVNERVHKDAIEVWTLKNSTMIAHPFHIHDVQFEVLDVNGGAVPDFNRGKKDVVLVMPQQSLRFITQFSDFADSTVPYMYHCHMLHHEDDGMMGSFVVTEAPTSIEIPISTSLSLYPQPASEAVSVVLDDSYSGEVEVLLIDERGASTKVFGTRADNGIVRCTLRGLSNGVYTLQLRYGSTLYRSLCVVAS